MLIFLMTLRNVSELNILVCVSISLANLKKRRAITPC